MNADIIKVQTNMNMSYELITPERAKDLLNSSGVNRKISDATVKAYMSDILNDNWDIGTSNSIAIDEDGLLRDGQHRCMAIVKTQKAEPMWVCRNVSKDGIYDNNRKRSVSDQIQISRPTFEGIYKSPKYISVAKAMISEGFDRRPVTPREVIDFTIQHKNDLDAFFFNIPYKQILKISIAVVYFSMFTAYMDGVSIDKLNEFYDILCTGMSTKEEEHPIIAYRNYLKDSSHINITKQEVARCQYAIRQYLNNSKTKESHAPKDLIYPVPYMKKIAH